MSDEGMGRPQEAYEELHEPLELSESTYEVPVPYGAQVIELDVDIPIPLNAFEITLQYLTQLGDKALARVMTTAVILYWSTGEGTDMAACLWKARELERESRP